VFRHVVLFRVHEWVADEKAVAAAHSLRALGDLPGVVSWQIERSLDDRKGRILIEEATFVDRDGFEAFRAHPRHAEVVGHLAAISDWWIADYKRPE